MSNATPLAAPANASAGDDNQLIAERRDKLRAIRTAASPQAPAFPNDYVPTHRAQALQAQYAKVEGETLKAQNVVVRIAGRMMLKRVMGKASFATVHDSSGAIQLYITENALGKTTYEAFRHWDLGDILGAAGSLFVTRTGELTLHCSQIRLLTKSLRPLPDKFHGIHDQELRYRQRYVDLMMDKGVRDRFVLRSRAISSLRQYMEAAGFLEVETPMLQPIAGGANARPFVTYHNALNQEMFLRIAPELYLKRLIVGGFERVFEINRNFRNEGISVRHNPEFTMMEFYSAWWNYVDVMRYSEAMLRAVVQQLCGSAELCYQGQTLDFAAPFARLSIREALQRYTRIGDAVDDRSSLLRLLRAAPRDGTQFEAEQKSLMALQVLAFEELVEEQLWQPTFICDHPVEISPLARANDQQPGLTERFELYIAGRELANGFSELNDAQDQAARFQQQVNTRAAGDDEAMIYDADYIRALEYGMPPTAGCGIGVDRFMMLLTDSPSIRDVLLFPSLRKEH